MKHRTIRWFGALVVGLAATTAGAVGAQEAQVDFPGPVDSLQDIQDSGKMLFKLADMNNDGQVSQREAVDAGNLLVGGFFFRADANGDGTLSREEAQSARDAFLSQRPMLRYIIETVRTEVRPGQSGQPGQPNQPAQPGQANATNDQNPLRNLATLFDSNNDRQLQATEVRQAVQTAVQGLYAAADTNRDGQMSPAEINAAVAGLARSLAQAAFQAADGDDNGAISQQEFERGVVEPSRIVFKILDADNDNQISQQEARGAEQFIQGQLRSLRVPEPANAPTRVLGSGNANPTQGRQGQPPAGTTPGQPPR